MALGEYKLLQFKNKEQRKKEEQEYALWAFPYGNKQKECLTTLMKEINPKSNTQINLVAFLTCKELYENTLGVSGSREETVYKMINTVKSYGQLIRKNEMPLYLALVLADKEIDENCEYPSVEEIRTQIQELVGLRKVSKFKLW